MGDKPIENIKVGDKVYSQNVDTGEKEYKEVKNVFVKETSTLVHLEVDGIKIDATETHPFLVEDGKLKVGDKVTLETGKKAKVESVTIEKLDKPVKVYNFEVADWHTYFVSEIGVLVHNKCTADPKVAGEASNLPALYDPDFAARQILNRSSNVTPGGRTITAHAAERMVTPPAGRVPTSINEIDEFLDTATSVRKISDHPNGYTVTLRNANSKNIKEVVVDAATGKRVITVITPKKSKVGANMEDKKDIHKIIDMLNKFISREDCSLEFAGQIEIKLDELFPDDDEIQDYVTCFASYRPGGGDFLYDEESMVKESKVLMNIIIEKSK